MNRRDLIVISALINAGLLIVLFATALKPEGKPEPIVNESTEIPLTQLDKTEKKEPVIAAGDEVDQVLKEFAARVMPETGAAPSASQEGVAPSSFAPIATQSPENQNIEQPPSLTEELAVHYPTQITLPEPAKKQETTNLGNTSREVRVKKGDFLDRIARRNGTSVSEIMRINNLTSTNLKIGQILKLPAKKGEVVRGTPASSSADVSYYVVQDGDNPWTIARKNQITVSELLRLNKLDDRSARRLKPGDRLRIR